MNHQCLFRTLEIVVCRYLTPTLRVTRTVYDSESPFLQTSKYIQNVNEAEDDCSKHQDAVAMTADMPEVDR